MIALDCFLWVYFKTVLVMMIFGVSGFTLVGCLVWDACISGTLYLVLWRVGVIVRLLLGCFAAVRSAV